MPAKHHQLQETQSAANQAKRIPRLSAGGPELFRGGHTCHRHTDSGCACSAADDRSPPYSRKLREFHTKLGVLSRRWRPSSRTAGPNRDPSPIRDASWLRSVPCATGHAHTGPQSAYPPPRDSQCVANANACSACHPSPCTRGFLATPSCRRPLPGTPPGRVKWSHAPASPQASSQKIQRTCHAPFAQPSASTDGVTTPRGRGLRREVTNGTNVGLGSAYLPRGLPSGPPASQLAQPTGCTSLQGWAARTFLKKHDRHGRVARQGWGVRLQPTQEFHTAEAHGSRLLVWGFG